MPTDTSVAWREYALLLIDVQHDFWPDSIAATAPGFPAAMERLLSSCRELGIAVVHVHARFAPDGSDWIACYRLRGRIPCISGTEGAEPLPVAAPLPGEPVVIKHTFDAFLGTDLDALLRGAGRRFLLLAGLVTSTCVLLTAASATQLGYLVAVVADCCADHPPNHDQVLATYPFMFSVTRSSRLAVDRRHWDEDLLALAVPTHSLGTTSYLSGARKIEANPTDTSTSVERYPRSRPPQT